MAKLTKKDEKNILEFHKLFPNSVQVRVFSSENGGYVAEIISFPGCNTQGETFSELIEMINDAVYTCLEIPGKYLSFMPTYLPSLRMAQAFNVFPLSKSINKKVNFSISVP